MYVALHSDRCTSPVKGTSRNIIIIIYYRSPCRLLYNMYTYIVIIIIYIKGSELKLA